MRRLRPPRIASLLFTGMVAACLSARADIIDGTDSLERQFPEVFAIAYAPDPASPAQKLCSAVLIHPRVLLTSAHCLPADSTTKVSVLEGANARAPTASYLSVRTGRNELYFSTQNESLRTGFDFGVVILAEDVPGADLKTGAKLARLASVNRRSDMETAHRYGVVVVGYGGQNTIHRDGTTGIQRWTTIPLAESIENAFTTTGSKGAISHGDSGGPAFILDRDGSRRLIGIASGTPENEKTDFTGISETSLYAGVRPKMIEWVEKTAEISLSRATTDEAPRFGKN